MTSTDGRSARTLRTRQIIRDAHIALINEGELKPSARQIAARAGVSVRALWDHFKDMESLMAATAERQLAAVLEALAPLARAADVQRPFSAALQQNLQENLNRIRYHVERLFDAELANLNPEPRTRMVLSICAAADWATWKLLRDHMGQSPDQARAVLETTLTALLAGHVNGLEHERKQNP